MRYMKKPSLFRKYVITYTLLFWVVVGLFIGGFYNHVKNNMEDKWRVEQSNKLLTVQYIIDFNFNQMSHIIRKIKEIDYIKDLKLERQIVETMELQKELREIKQFSPLVDEIIIGIKGNKYIYSDVTTYTEETLKEVRGIQLPNGIGQENDKKIQMIDTLSDGEEENNIMVTYSLKAAKNKEIGTVNLVLNSKELKKIINQVISTEDKQFLILINNKLAWQLMGIAEPDLFYIQSQVANQIKGYHPIRLENKEYSLFYNTSADTQIKYIYCANDIQKQSELTYINRVFGVMSFLCMILSGGIIYLIVYYNYKPLKNIKEMISGIELGDMADHNEFEMIENVIDQLNNENMQLDSTLEQIMGEQESYLYYKLLKGVHDEKIEQITKQLESEEPIDYCVAIYCAADTEEIETNKQRIGEVLEQVFYNRIIHIEMGLEKNQVVCILNIKGMADEALRRVQEEIQSACIDKGTVLSIAIGNKYSSWDKIAKSFEEAQNALDYRNLADSNQIIWYENVVTYREDLQLPSWLLAKLRVDISKVNIGEVKEDINNIREFVSKQDITYNTAKSICKRVMNEVVESLDDVLKNQFYQNDNCPTVSELKQVDSMKKVIVILDKIKETTCEVLECGEKHHIETSESKADLYMHIIRYIKKHYMNCDLSIQEIAEQNQIALPNLTTYFKKQVGQTPKDYLTYIRMKHAKELLITTKVPLNDVANQSGYQNVSSFIRQFKKIEGVTPGEYRKYNTKK